MFKKFYSVLFINFFVFGLFFVCNNVFAVSNVLTNHGAESGDASGWSNIVNGGDGWEFDWGSHTGSYGFDSSYLWDSMDQTVDLLDAGYSQEELDAIPDIAFSSWITQRGDKTGEYYMIYSLLDVDHNVIETHTYGSEGSPVQLSAGTSWFENTYTFSDYTTSTRFVYIKFAGEDTGPNWAGSYGPYFDDFIILVNDSSGPDGLVFTPLDNAVSVGTTSSLEIDFGQDVTTSTGNIVIYNANDNSVFETIDVNSDLVTADGTTAFIINPVSDFSSLSDYYILIDSGTFNDVFGNDFSGISSSSVWNFTTIDNEAPVISSLFPSGEQSADTTSVTLSVVTDENATCKYSRTSGTDFGDMVFFSTTGVTNHVTNISGLKSGTSYNYFVICQDTLGYTSSQSNISFSISNPTAIFILPSKPKILLEPVFTNDSFSYQVEDGYQMAVSESKDFSNVSWEPYSSSYKTRNKILYIKFRNKEGGVSDVYVLNSIVNTKDQQNEFVFTVTSNVIQNIDYTFVRDLKINMKGKDVKELQKYLNKNGFILADSGFGSLGNETDYFGKMTQNALIKFQQSKNLPAYGYFGKMTKSVLK
ncbi:MAG: peptidoglycan-binding protein [Candidatus Magasanikbacteria bacterium]